MPVDVAGELTRLFVLYKTAALSSAEFAAAKSALLSPAAEEPGVSGRAPLRKGSNYARRRREEEAAQAQQRRLVSLARVCPHSFEVREAMRKEQAGRRPWEVPRVRRHHWQPDPNPVTTAAQETINRRSNMASRFMLADNEAEDSESTSSSDLQLNCAPPTPETPPAPPPPPPPLLRIGGAGAADPAQRLADAGVCAEGRVEFVAAHRAHAPAGHGALVVHVSFPGGASRTLEVDAAATVGGLAALAAQEEGIAATLPLPDAAQPRLSRASSLTLTSQLAESGLHPVKHRVKRSDWYTPPKKERRGGGCTGKGDCSIS